MAKYRRKPVIMEAEQFKTEGRKLGEVIDFCERNRVKINGYHVNRYGDLYSFRDEILPNNFIFCKYRFSVDTLEREDLKVIENDWIVHGVNREVWPVKPDIFKKTYEAI